ncbi:MAG: hypothetical protein ABIK44_05520 [candidate division WOR-3 bacterium]
MNTTMLVRETAELDGIVRLVQDIESLAGRRGNRALLLAELAQLERRLAGMKRRLLAAVLCDLLWQFLEFCEGDLKFKVKELLVLIGTG